MVNFGPLTAEIGSGVWGTPANFNGFRILAALLHGSQIVIFGYLSCVYPLDGGVSYNIIVKYLCYISVAEI